MRRTRSGPASNTSGSRRVTSLHAREQLGGGDARRPANSPTPPDRRERLVALAAERPGEQRVVAELGVGVERQVVGGERHVVAEQRPQPLGSVGVEAGGRGSPRTGRGGRARARPPSATARSISSRCADTPGDHRRTSRRRGPGGRWGRSRQTHRDPAARRAAQSTAEMLVEEVSNGMTTAILSIER